MNCRWMKHCESWFQVSKYAVIMLDEAHERTEQASTFARHVSWCFRHVGKKNGWLGSDTLKHRLQSKKLTCQLCWLCNQISDQRRASQDNLNWCSLWTAESCSEASSLRLPGMGWPVTRLVTCCSQFFCFQEETGAQADCHFSQHLNENPKLAGLDCLAVSPKWETISNS